MHFIKKVSFAGGLLVAIVPFVALAQAQTSGDHLNPPTSTSTVTSVVTVFADVNFMNVRATTTDGILKGQYSLQGKMGEQNGINVGIVISDPTTGLLIDAVPLAANLSIQQGEVEHYTFSYPLPTHLSGKVNLMLKAETASGLPLAFVPLGATTFKGPGRTLTCELPKDHPGTITCSSKQDATITIAYAKGGVVAPTTTSETKQIKQGKSISFVPQLPAGKYAAHISDAATKESYTIPFFVPGEYGMIGSISVSRVTTGTLHVVVVANTSVKDTSSVLALTSKSGEECGSKDLKSTGSTATFDIVTSCTEGTARVSLLDSKGATLDSRAESFSVVPFGSTSFGPMTGRPSTRTVLAIGAGVLLLALLMSWVIRRRSAAAIVPVILIAFFSSVPVPTHALSFTLTFVCSGGACPIATGISGNTGNQGGPFGPGDTINESVAMWSDDNPQYTDYSCGGAACVSPIAQIATALDSTSYGSDLFPGSYTQQQMRNGVVSNTQYISIPYNTSTGTHYINGLGAAGGYNTVTGGEAVTVQPWCDAMYQTSPDTVTWNLQNEWTLYVGQSSSPGEPQTSKNRLTCVAHGTTCNITQVTPGGSAYQANCGFTPSSPPTVQLYFSLLDKVRNIFTAFAAER